VKKFVFFIVCYFFWIGQVLAAQRAVEQFVVSCSDKALCISKSDIKAYRRIFSYVDKEEISEALEKTEYIDNDILLGHVKAEIFLSKTYKTKADELKKWLEKFNNLPQARSIYNLAVMKSGKDKIENPWGEKYPVIYSPYSWYNNQYENLSDADRKYVRKQVSKFRRYINSGKTKAARTILENKKFRMTIPDKEYDAMSVTLATVYMLDNYNKLAWQWVQKATKRSDDSMGYWVGGLAAWKMKQYKNAVSFFTKLGAKRTSDEWLVSAGAYWAYRSYMKLGKKTEAQKWLRVASIYKRTFYGMLANYQLGLPWHYDWDGISFFGDYSSCNYINEIAMFPEVKRALVLLVIGKNKLAEKEIKSVYKNMNKRQKEILLFIAQSYEMHSLAITLVNDIKDNENGVFYDKIAYPVPDWKPKGGWKIDSALVWALVRQESAFYPMAQSRAGARGLMQLMPMTAFHISKNKKIKRDKSVLFDTRYNLTLGQKYVNYLAEKDYINGNLFYLIAAYNAGPGNLYKWQKKLKYNNDPLLFIEVLPAKETRIYIERVMANFWIYNARFGREHKSLDALSKGKWPKI